MIAGVGTDIVAIERMRAFWQCHGERGGKRLLGAEEQLEIRASKDPARLLAKRFAAKEALAKALGTGLRAPVLLPAIQIRHDALGKPEFEFDDAVAALMSQRGVRAHLSISDEKDYALAFVVLETQ